MTTYFFLSRSDQSRCRFCLGNLFLQFAPCSRIQAIKVEAVWLCSSKLLSCFNRRGTLKARGTAVRLQTCEGTVMALWYATFGKVSFYDYYHHLIIALSQLTSLIAPLESFSSITPQNRLLHLNDHMYYGCFQVCLSVWSCFILTVNLVKQLSESLLLSQSSVSNNENDSRIKTDLLSICGRPPCGGLW